MGFRPTNSYLSVVSALGLPDPKLLIDTGALGAWTAATRTLNSSLGTPATFANSAPEFVNFQGVDGGMTLDDGLLFSGHNSAHALYSSTTPSWAQVIHKAGATFSIFAWVRPQNPSVPTLQTICGNDGGSLESYPGFRFYTNKGTPTFFARNNSRTTVISVTHTARFLPGVWNSAAIACDASIGAGGLNFIINGVSQLFNSTYTAPDSVNAGSFGIGSSGSLSNTNPFTGMIGMLAMWDTVLTAAQFQLLATADVQKSFSQLHGLPNRGCADPIFVRQPMIAMG